MNVKPIFTSTPAISVGVSVATAQNTYDGTGANDTLVFTADSTDGSFVSRLRFKAKGTNVATVARVYINNGSTVGTASNNTFFGEIGLPATTASASAATPDVDYPMNVALPAGYKIYVGVATTVSAGWAVTAVGGAYTAIA
jgi:hypothetical protein